MKCPGCGFDNIAGADHCESCLADLADQDGITPKDKIGRSLMHDPIASLKPREAVSIPEHASVLAAVQKMNEIKAGCVLVEDARGRLCGLFTERDLLFRVLGKVKDIAKAKVKDYMTPDPGTLDEDDPLAFAYHMMAIKRFRHIPILRENKKSGIISVRDLLKHMAGQIK